MDNRKYKGRQFINISTDTYGVETIDEFDTRKEASTMLREYRLVYQGSGISPWISQRPDKTWYEEESDATTE